jgi:hypothetical protein
VVDYVDLLTAFMTMRMTASASWGMIIAIGTTNMGCLVSKLQVPAPLRRATWLLGVHEWRPGRSASMRAADEATTRIDRIAAYARSKISPPVPLLAAARAERLQAIKQPRRQENKSSNYRASRRGRELSCKQDSSAGKIAC